MDTMAALFALRGNGAVRGWPLSQPGKLYIICEGRLAQRTSFLQEVEHTVYPPNTSLNQHFECCYALFLGILFAIIGIPQDDRKIIENIAAGKRLRLDFETSLVSFEGRTVHFPTQGQNVCVILPENHPEGAMLEMNFLI